MKKIFVILLILFVSNCSTKKLENNHGLVNLDKKKNEITVGKTNKNDVVNLFGPASTVSTFDDNIWIFIERVQTKGKIFKFGRNVTKVNNALVLKFNDYGLVSKKEFYDIDKNQKIKFSENVSESPTDEEDFIYSFLSSLRQKINNPLNKKIVPRN